MLMTSPYLAESTLEPIHRLHTIYNFLTNRNEMVDVASLAILKRCLSPTSERELIQEFALSRLEPLIRQRLLLDSERVWQEHDVRVVEIEIGTQCNWRCEYCPKKEYPVPPAVMPMELFADILQKAAASDSLREVSLNSYNEPTLDPFFEQRIRLIAKNGLRLCLYTNASMLSEERLRLLKDSGVLSFCYVNLPSQDPETFTRLTGGADWKTTFRALDLAVQWEMPVRLSVQGTPQEKQRRAQEIHRRWPSLEISQWQTSDRLGLLTGAYAQNVSVEADRLFGCYHIFHSICVDVHGDCYLCCNDYHKVSRFDSIKNKSFDEILTGEKMQRLRKEIFGAVSSGQSLLCRRCDVMRDNRQLMRVMRWLRKPI